MRSPLARLLGRRPVPYLSLVGLWTTLRGTVLLAGVLLQRVFDALAGTGHRYNLAWLLVAALVANESARLFLWYGVVLSRVEPSYTYRIRSALQDNVLRRALDRPAAAALDRPVGDVISRVGDDADQVGTFAIWSASNVSRLLVAVGALTIMFWIDVRAAAALVLPVIVVTVVGQGLTAAIGQARAASRAAGGEVSTIVGEAMGAVLAVKVGRAERRMIGRLRAANAVRLRVAVREELLTAVQSSLFRSMAALGTGLLLLVAASQLRSGAFTVGDLAMFVFYIQFVTEAVNALGMFPSRVKRATLSLHRLAELTGGADEAIRPVTSYLDRPPPPLGETPTVEEPLTSLRVVGLTVCHAGSEACVRDATFTVLPHTLTVVTGRVGAGKSTLVGGLLGLLPIQSGEIYWNDRPVADPDTFFVPSRTAYLPQVPRLFSGSLADNILLGREHSAERTYRAVRDAVFEEDLAHLPDGLQTVLGPRGLRLSGGQIQRVGVARAVVPNPQLLVLDDVSNALDPATENALWERLLADGRTVLAVSHRPDVLLRADQVILLVDGRIAAVGPPATLRRTCPQLRAILALDDGAPVESEPTRR